MKHTWKLLAIAATVAALFVGCEAVGLGGGNGDDGNNESDGNGTNGGNGNGGSTETYVVEYRPNGAEGGTAPTDGTEYAEGDTVQVRGRNSLVKNNQVLKEWNTTADGSGTGYEANETFSMPANDVTLYAQWEPIDYTNLFTVPTVTGLASDGYMDGSVSVADVNDDGYPDLLLTGENASFDPTTTLYLGGASEFTARTELGPGVAHSSSDFADVNGDGYPDLVISGENEDGNPITGLYINDALGNANFSRDNSESTVDTLGDLSAVMRGSTTFLSIGESSDTDPDLLLTGQLSGGSGVAELYTNDGSGGFTKAGAGLEAVSAGESPATDLTGDGKPEIVLTGADSGGNPVLTVYENNGTGDFSVLESSTDSGTDLSGVLFGSVSHGDLNGDGEVDLLVTGVDLSLDASTTLYLNTGSGSFSKDPQSTGGGSSVFAGVTGGSSTVTDIDADGDLDIILTGAANVTLSFGALTPSFDTPQAALYVNDGEGNFTKKQVGLTPVLRSASAAFDYGGDGDTDLIITGRDTDAEATAVIYENTLELMPQ